MVNADAVFGDERRPSGLWQEVGAARARARGLEPSALRDYYRQRNLLKASVTPDHARDEPLHRVAADLVRRELAGLAAENRLTDLNDTQRLRS